MYHLPRAAAWAQHDGIYWIPFARNVELNAYQPLAEQQILFLFVAVGSGALLAPPQFLAELAALVAVYGAARRLGFAVRPAACSACLVATFCVAALEATTAQNDLVTASFTAVASCFRLGGGVLEPALAGAAAAFGLGTKLTGGLVVPFLVALALVRGRRVFAAAAAGGERSVPPHACVGAVLDVSEPSYLLYGPRFGHHVVYLPPVDTVVQANAHDLSYVVLSTSLDYRAPQNFVGADWRVRRLGGYWLLASRPGADGGGCER
jgi:hypothetical protein